ncbi:MAG: ABC transporter substrate-binding protein [Desertimonas sp.]
MSKRRAQRLATLGTGLVLAGAAIAGPAAATTVPDETAAPDTTSPETATADSASDDTAAAPTAGGGGMTLTINLAEEAVWEDASPITWVDLECTWRANLNTPGAIKTAGYDQITAVSAGESDKQVVVEFSSVYGPYKSLFNPIIKNAAVENCDDVSGDFATELPISGRAVMVESWSESQLVMVPNPNYWGDDTMAADSVVMIPYVDQDTEIASMLAGEVDFIYPQFGDTLGAALQADNIEIGIASGGDYEGFYFQQEEGRPFADPDFRAAFSMSIDRDALFAQIYAPIYESAGAVGELLNCGPIVQGPYCPEDNFQGTYDLDGAETLLTDAGWERNADGFWAKDGEVPEIEWTINTGNGRRENTQAYLIPLLAEAGFNVVPANGTAEEVFQQRLPAGDFDLAMYISTAPPDPSYLVPFLTCENIPNEENNMQGQNTQFWCNEEASAALNASDIEVDPDTRIELVQTALRLVDEDHVMLPLANYPKSGVWNVDKVAGPLDGELANYRAFANFHLWEDVDGDGQIVIGAEQWPGCLNPITECANSSWYLWTVAFPTLPGVWDTTNDQGYEITNLVTEEPVVEVNG